MPRGNNELPSAFVTGAFARVKVGLRSNVAVFPRVTELLAKFVHQQLPKHKFTSIVLFDDVQTEPHRDAQNAFVPNAVIALTPFKGGQLWVECSSGTEAKRVHGQELLGQVLDIQQGHALFDARRSWHCTEPWEGRRVTLVAFSIAACQRLSTDASFRLRDLGFMLPDQDDLATAEANPCKPHLVRFKVPSPEPRVPDLKNKAGEAADPNAPHLVKLPPPLTPSGSGPASASATPQKGIPGKPVRRRLILELCTGSAQLSRCFIEAGFDALPIDHKQNRFHPFAKVCNLSLTETSAWAYLKDILKDHDVDYVHIAPPCGTCSMARHIQRQPSDPKPLRSQEHLMGLPNLGPQDKARVEAANAIYMQMADFVQSLHSRSILWSIENPGNSWLWKLPCMAPIVKLGTFCMFDACVFGGERKTLKCFLSNVSTFLHLCQRCNGGHSHKPFGKLQRPDGTTYFATKDEAAYPRALCVQIVHLVCLQLQLPLPNFQPQPDSQPAQATARQPRGRRVLPVVPEFAHIFELELGSMPQVDSKRCLLHSIQSIPAGSKLISSTKLNVEGGSEVLVEDDSPGVRYRVVLGVFHSPEEFVSKALAAVHPFDKLDVLPDIVKRKMHEALVRGPAWVQQSRAKTLDKWLRWARQSQAQEDEVHASLDPAVARVLSGKRLLLLERIAGSLGWQDEGVFSELRKGFRLVGVQPHTRVFARDIRPPLITEQELLQSFVFMRPALIGKVASARPSELDSELWSKTLDEVSDGSLVGPLTRDQVDARHGTGWVPVRRFGVVQSSAGKRKLRPVDDFSECKVNSAFGSADKVDLKALDEFVAMCRLWNRAVLDPGMFTIALSDGQTLEGLVHRGWESAGGKFPLITTLDLRSAYKQLPISSGCKPFAMVALPHPVTRQPQFFEAQALPFGSSSSVLHFNRVSHLLWRIGIELFLFWSCFFDDYPVMSPGSLAASTKETMLLLMRLLGFACSDEKLEEFAAKATVLGVEVDCSRSSEGKVLIRNKQGRAEEVCQALQQLLVQGSMSRAEYSRIMGRLQYADAQVMGRSGRLAMAEIRRWAKSSESSALRLEPGASEAYKVLMKRLLDGVPREIPCRESGDVWHVFTDGASEGASNTVGGVLHRRGCKHVRFFSCEVPPELVKAWAGDMKHIIGPVEAYAVLVARTLWHQFLANHHVVFHVDNYGAMDAFIKGTSSNAQIRRILLAFEEAEYLHHTWPWFSRVPSRSNCADDPSKPPGLKLLSAW